MKPRNHFGAAPRPRFRWPLAAALAVCAFLAPGSAETEAAPAPATHPNIVLIVADDLGWSDLACYGADLHETPNIDALAASGMRFTQAYAPAPVCSPTRAALLTGRAPARLGMTTWSEGALDPADDRPLLPAPSKPNLPRSEVSLARLLQAAGYRTALVGKWHLGDADHAPETHGFDVNIGGTRWGAPATYFWPYRSPDHSGKEFRYVPHLEFGKPGEYLTDRLTDEAVRVIDRLNGESPPFFLMVAHHAPHTPIEAPSGDVEFFQRKLTPAHHQRNPAYAAMVRRLDSGVGRIVETLKSRSLLDRTIVVFTSDNGGYIGIDRRQTIPVTTNAPLRSGKASLYEGGLRVPLVVRWPGVTPAGTVSETPVILTDLFHTLRPLAGSSPPPGPAPATEDGLDLGPVLRDPKATLHREALYFHFPHYYHAPATTPVGAIRAGDWKLIEHFEDNRLELFDLSADPGETNDLSQSLPDRVRELQGRLAAWRRDVAARLPTPNPARATPSGRTQ